VKIQNLGKNLAFFTKATGLATIIVGSFALIGWICCIPFLKTVLPGITSTKYNTAVCFIFSGIALYQSNATFISQSHKKIVFICASIILLIGILNLSEYIFGYSLGNTRFQDQMSISTAINFIFLGFVFLMLSKRKFHWPIQILLIVMISGYILVILNHLFGVSFLSSIPELNNTALFTAILFIVICLAVFFSPALGYLHFSFMIKIAGFFMLIFLVRSIIFFALNKSNELAADTDRQVEHTHEVSFMAEKINSQSEEMQSEVRTYIITGEENYLPLITNTVDTIFTIMGHLRTITKTTAVHHLLLDTLGEHLNSYIDFQKELYNIRRVTYYLAKCIQLL
jgi:ABC-type nickel/cobalt efflux system permease component RcnA